MGDAIGRAVMIGKIAAGEIEDEREELSSTAAQLGSEGGEDASREYDAGKAR